MGMKRFRTLFFVAVFLLPLSACPFSVSAATSFEVSGWIPYWRAATGTADVLPHLDELTEVNPFVYTLKNDGTLYDNGSLDAEPWLSFIAAAKRQKVRVIPTVMSPGGAALHAILANTTERIALETNIANLVKQKGYDGIDIDFEGKEAADKDYFSTFLRGLYARMGPKWVMCDIEARTPTDSRYYGTTIPPDAAIYANDFTQINKYCDRVRIMAYDQQGVDLQLAAQAASSSQIYAPIADPAWVTKVVQLAEKSIKPSKIEIGVPTYGYEYDVTAYASDQYMYNILWTFNPGYASTTAQQYGVAPQRAPWGEMEFSYIPISGTTTPAASAVSGSFISAFATVAAASTFATDNNSHVDFHLLVWSDAQAIAQKIALAKSLGIRGVSIFKLDGGEDPNLWSVLQGVKK
jgi:spore germination protein YaaH